MRDAARLGEDGVERLDPALRREARLVAVVEGGVVVVEVEIAARGGRETWAYVALKLALTGKPSSY